MDLKQEKVRVVDARYKSCPGPLLSLMEALKDVEDGQVIKLLSTDPSSPRDVEDWTSSANHKFLGFKEKDGVYEIFLEVRK